MFNLKQETQRQVTKLRFETLLQVFQRPRHTSGYEFETTSGSSLPLYGRSYVLQETTNEETPSRHERPVPRLKEEIFPIISRRSMRLEEEISPIISPIISDLETMEKMRALMRELLELLLHVL